MPFSPSLSCSCNISYVRSSPTFQITPDLVNLLSPYSLSLNHDLCKNSIDQFYITLSILLGANAHTVVKHSLHFRGRII
jgi:hypothetical protein